MALYRCWYCQLPAWNLHQLPPLGAISIRWTSWSAVPPTSDVAAILSQPSWSVKSLLPGHTDRMQTPTVTPKQLRHLLQLSALPQPSGQAEEDDMLQTLESQIHFVKEIQSVKTAGVIPLRSIRDETNEAQKENTIQVRDLETSLEQERYVGRSRRIKRTKAKRLHHPDGEIWDWDALKSASKTMGRYFVVQSENQSKIEKANTE